MTEFKSIANKFYSEVINNGDQKALELIVDENFIDHYAAPDLPKGREGFIQFLKRISGAFPDIQVKVEELIEEDDKVVARLSVNGTHKGVLGNLPPSGINANWTGIDILKIKKGKIMERWSQRDLLGMMKQIGAVK